MAESRLLGADFVRALACLMVLGHHLVQRLSPDVVGRGFRPAYAFAHMGSFGVAAFFVLSGFLLSRPFWLAYDARQPMPSLRVFAIRRAARILPGYWLALTVSVVLAVVLFGWPLTGELWTRYAAGLFFVSDFHYLTFFPAEFNGPLWSISFEVTSYVLLPLCLAAVFLLWPRRSIWGGRIAWLVIIAAVLGLHHLIVSYWPVDDLERGWQFGVVGGAKEWMPRYNPVGFFGIFAIGVLAAALQVQAVRFRHWAFDLLVLAGFALAVWTIIPSTATIDNGSAWGWLAVPYGFPGFPLGIALVLCAAPSSRIAGWLMDNPAARYLAQLSFGIYVWHYLIIELVRQLWYPDLQYHGVVNVTEWLLISAAVVGVAVLIAHLSYNLLEAPVIAWARRREKRPAPPSAEPATAPS